MPEEKVAVTTESAPVTQEVVKETPETTQQAETNETQPVTTETAPQTPQQGNADLDEFGVPWKNRAMEYKRKQEEMVERLPSLLEETVSNVFAKQGQHVQEPSIEQLELYKLENQTNPQAVAWAEAKKEEIRQKNIVKQIEERLDKSKKADEAERKKQEAYQYVVSSYPDAFVKDSQGRVLGWNNQHPLTQAIGQIMNNPEIKSHPEGLAFAADAAYGRISRMQNPMLRQNETRLKAEVKDLQKKTLVEGGSRQPVNTVPEHKQLIEKAKRTGNLKDVAAAMTAMAKFQKAQQETK